MSRVVSSPGRCAAPGRSTRRGRSRRPSRTGPRPGRAPGTRSRPGRTATRRRRRTGPPRGRGRPSTPGRPAAPNGSPVRFETTGISRRAGRSARRATARNSSSIGSISGEWNACDTRSRLVLRSPNSAAIVEHRVLVAGDHHRGRPVDRRDRDALGQVRGDLVLGGLDRHHRAARGQRLHQPATRRDQRAGVLQGQHPGHVRGGDLTDRMPRAGSPAVRPRTRPAGTAPPRPRTARAARTGLVQRARHRPPRHGRRGAPASHAAANTGKRSYSSRPMPSRCEPWPENRNGQRTAVRPRPRRDLGRRRAAPRGARTPTGPSPARTPTSSADGVHRGPSRSHLTRPARPRPAPRPATAPRPAPATGSGALDRLGACSRITCALVPLIPNDDTPARRARPASGHEVVRGQQLDRTRLPVHVRRRRVDVQRLAAARRAASPGPS